MEAGASLTSASDLFYNVKLNAAVAIFQIFATQMIGYGVAGAREWSLLLVHAYGLTVYSPHAFGLPYVVRTRRTRPLCSG